MKFFLKCFSHGLNTDKTQILRKNNFHLNPCFICVSSVAKTDVEFVLAVKRHTS